MKHDSDVHHRRSIRLKGHDYAQPGAYFVTICTRGRECVLGEIVDGKMRLNARGMAVHEEWLRTAGLREYVQLDGFVIMPNHMHGIVVITNCRGTARRAPTERFGKPVPDSIATIMRAFKSGATKRINEIRNTPGSPVWQRNYYEHIIRNDEELNAIRHYIFGNPANWTEDENYRV